MIEQGIYQHFKGNRYEVLCIAKNSEDLSDMVVYRDVTDSNKIWVRPASMWEETVIHNGESVPRFTRIKQRNP